MRTRQAKTNALLAMVTLYSLSLPACGNVGRSSAEDALADRGTTMDIDDLKRGFEASTADLDVPETAADAPAPDLPPDLQPEDLPAELTPDLGSEEVMDATPADIALFDEVSEPDKPSPCACDAAADCEEGLVCETELKVCVPSKCTGKSCANDEICDPYKGKCMPATIPDGAGIPCDSTAECPDGVSCPMVCNTYVGVCIDHDCCMDGCFPPKTCSPLLHTCANCFTDCDCPNGQKCGATTHTCAPCNEAIINFTQNNYPAFEFFEICVPDDMSEAVTALQAIQPEIYCGVAGGFAGCSDTETGCHGEFDYQPGIKKLTDECWAKICQMSMLEFVSKIGGGHFIE